MCFTFDDDSYPQNTVVSKKDVLSKPEHPIVKGIIFAYTASTELYSELNKALRDKITTYSDTMGPYSYILYQLIKYGSNFRDDI